MGWARDVVPLVSRILMAGFFIPSGLKLTRGFSNWIAYYATRSPVLLTQAHPKTFLITAIAAEAGIGMALLLGLKTRWAAAILILYVALWSVLFHGYWDMPDADYASERINFFKNGALIAGLLMIAVHGGGGFSLDTILHRLQSSLPDRYRSRLSWPHLDWPHLDWPHLDWPHLDRPLRLWRPRVRTHH